MEKLTQTFRVDLTDIGSNFGMRPSAVLKYYQEVFARYCAIHNVAGYNVDQYGLKWVFGQTIVNYSTIIPIWNEKLIATVYVGNVKKLRLYLNFEISSPRGVVATGQGVAFLLDKNTSRPQPVDLAVERFKIDPKEANGEILVADFSKNGELVSTNNHTITFMDLDYNKHTNNISYLLLGVEGMPAEFVKVHHPRTIAIKYLQETFLGDTLEIKTYQDGEEFLYDIVKAEDNSSVCTIKANWQAYEFTPDDYYKVLAEVLGSVGD